MAAWTIANIPDQSGRTAIVTGASSGIGEEAASALAGRGAHVVLAVRDPARGNATVARIRAAHPDAAVEVSLVDMASLASVREFAARMSGMAKLDLLLNNAGLMQAKRSVTVDGFERMFGTNHLGHFVVTGALIETLLRAHAPRVVTIASVAHRRGGIDFDDLQGERHYGSSKGYAQSKLANLMFALELDRRARAAGSKLVSVAAHPGVATTGFAAAVGMPGFAVPVVNTAIGLLGQDAAAGALPGLYAATMPDVEGGQYWGPDGWREIRGWPRLAVVSPQGQDRQVAARLWSVSEQLTGMIYPPLA